MCHNAMKTYCTVLGAQAALSDGRSHYPVDGSRSISHPPDRKIKEKIKGQKLPSEVEIPPTPEAEAKENCEGSG